MIMKNQKRLLFILSIFVVWIIISVILLSKKEVIEIPQNPVVKTWAIYNFDDSRFQIESEVYKLNKDGTAEKRILKQIKMTNDWFRYYIEWCWVEEYNWAYNYKLEQYEKIYWYRCRDWENVTYIGNTEEELYSNFCE